MLLGAKSLRIRGAGDGRDLWSPCSSQVLGQICSWKLHAPIQCEVTQCGKCPAVRLGRFWPLGFFSKLILSPGICLQFTSQAAQQLCLFSSSAFYVRRSKSSLAGRALVRSCAVVVCSSTTALSQPGTLMICEEHAAASCSAGWLTEFLGQSHSQDAHPELHSIIFDRK